VLAEKERLERQKEAILARRRAPTAEAFAAESVPAEAPNVIVQRPIFDTGPIAELARSGVRTLRSVRRRPQERVPETV
jgi:hypothetical protein